MRFSQQRERGKRDVAAMRADTRIQADMTGRGAELPVQEVSPKSHPPGRLRVISYHVMLDVPRELVLYVLGLLAERRREEALDLSDGEGD